MASEIRVNSLTNRSGLSTVSITDTGAVVAGLVTATSFSGPLTGAVTGNVTGNLTGNVTGNVTGNLTGNVTGTATTATALSGSPSITVTDITATGNVSIGGTLTYEDVTNIDSVGIVTAQSDVHVGAGLSVVGITTTQSDVLVGRNLSVTSGISTVKSLDYAAIDSTISDTAVDVFIYDTSKDSDGGAWRKRTQHTSWYNETLNTSTRGSRREFPAVAVIVALDNVLRIYDGDDPDLPMWMVFTSADAPGYTGPHLNIAGGSTLSAVAALNGEIVVTCNSGSYPFGSVQINFLKDRSLIRPDVGGKLSITNIAKRNVTGSYNANYAYTALVDKFANDVAMTVLPNAPIDDATGLPVPTIAVATNNGVSVIKDDGTVFDVIDSNGARKCYDVSFTKDHKIMHTGDLGAGSTHAGNVFVTNVLTADRAEYDNHSDLYRWYSTSQYYPRINGGNTFNTRVLDPIDVGGNHYAMADVGVSLIEDGTSSSYGNTDGMVAYATTSFNTGYMVGDIKGAFLSDTDTTNLVDTNLVSNGTFDSNTTGWSSSGNITVTQDSGRLKMVSGSGNPHVHTAVTCVVGKRYYFQADFQGEVSFHASSQASSVGDVAYIPYLSYGSSTTRHCFFTATATTMYLVPHVIGTGNTGYVDNVICKLADHDRSVYGNPKATVGGVNGIGSGLATYGTITKSAVATGADLVSYGPFSTSNRLRQPYNSDLNFGTNDFSIIFWMYNTGSTVHQTLVGRDNREFSVDILDNANYDRKFRIYAYNSGNSMGSFDSNADPFPVNTWSHICVNYTNGNTVAVYVNGVLNKSGSLNYDIDDTSNGLNIGCRNTSGSYAHAADATKLSLVRISKSAPSPEQIKKMYEDEKVLFQENAKATLYGSSDAVTALAYDDDTDLLHVGTSSGRSDFQGLRRINNTTTAVTTAITAQNEFIIEQ